MSIDRIVLAVAGLVILISIALTYWVHPNWMFLAAFVGFNLLQSAFTGFCPMAMILKAIGKKPGAAFD